MNEQPKTTDERISTLEDAMAFVLAALDGEAAMAVHQFPESITAKVEGADFIVNENDRYQLMDQNTAQIYMAAFALALRTVGYNQEVDNNTRTFTIGDPE